MCDFKGISPYQETHFIKLVETLKNILFTSSRQNQTAGKSPEKIALDLHSMIFPILDCINIHPW